MPLFKIVDDSPEFLTKNTFLKMRDQITHRLLTVCTVYDEFPNIRYLGQSPTCKSFAEKLQDNFKQFYKRNKKVKPHMPRATFLLLDRSFDLVAPVIHDYYY